MSSIYNQEPPTRGLVKLKTSKGDIDITLWPKEAPRACRNFLQLCLEGYYHDTIFHRVVPRFIIQGGDPTGTGEGGTSIYGEPFKNEFHSRLRFVRRGLVAMANAGKDDNGSQFFITLDGTEELQNKHTIFGTVVGDTIFNVLKIGESEIDADERPLLPPRILDVVVEDNPIEDIVPRTTPEERRLQLQQQKEDTIGVKFKKRRKMGVKNKNLLSFGKDEEEAEEEVEKVSKVPMSKGEPIQSFKMKSLHDVIHDDPRIASTSRVAPTAPLSTNSLSMPAEKSGHVDSNREPVKSIALIDTISSSTILDGIRKLVDNEETSTEIPSPPFPATTTSPHEDHTEYTGSKGKRGKKRSKDHEDALFARLAGFKQHIIKERTGHNPNSTVPTGESVPKGNGFRRPLLDPLADAPDDFDSQWLTHRLNFKNSNTQPGHHKTPDHVNDYEVIDSRVDRYKGRESMRN
ncbi:Peptidyl-prolyl isomerase cwc27 [Dispira simplex]|nr:Peptidyl-prolyl isomerase cwc27 [Dispira simplex]